jgi:hypothetical protein
VGGATDDLFIIKNLLLYLSDSAQTWLEHLSRGNINDWTELRRVFVGNFQGTYARLGKQWDLCNCKEQSGEAYATTSRASPSVALIFLAGRILTPSQHSRITRPTPPTSTD